MDCISVPILAEQEKLNILRKQFSDYLFFFYHYECICGGNLQSLSFLAVLATNPEQRRCTLGTIMSAVSSSSLLGSSFLC
jgi:hypothetical protein